MSLRDVNRTEKNMKTDITLPITEEMLEDARRLENRALRGHLGTHFDVMDKVFPLEYTKRRGVIFDVSGVGEREIDVSDIDTEKIAEGDFVLFYTGYIESEKYGSARYFSLHPQLSRELIALLLDKKVSIIGVDCAGIRRTPEHIPTDAMCAERGVFIIENLCNLRSLLNCKSEITVHTYPLNIEGVTGLVCRVIAEIE